MNLEQVIASLKAGEQVSPIVAPNIIYKMCHGEQIMMLNTDGCTNGITATIENVLTLDEFVKQFEYMGLKDLWATKSYMVE